MSNSNSSHRRSASGRGTSAQNPRVRRVSRAPKWHADVQAIILRSIHIYRDAPEMTITKAYALMVVDVYRLNARRMAEGIGAVRHPSRSTFGRHIRDYQSIWGRGGSIQAWRGRHRGRSSAA